MALYIHQYENWTNFKYNPEVLLFPLGEVRNLQGKLMGKMQSLGFELQNEAILETFTLDVLKNSEIEGEILDLSQVRSSIARRLGLDVQGLNYPDRQIEGIVEMMLDATQNYDKPLTTNRLFDWHAALFPTGRNGMYKITVADWRKDENGPMQVISGALGKEKIHFQAVEAASIAKEMDIFLNWFNNESQIEGVIKAALAHLWFITIHPFDDGNCRIARALTDMLLARADGSAQRFYSMSAQIRLEREEYYAILEKTQKGDAEITDWLIYFLACLKKSLITTEEVLSKILYKSTFWQIHQLTSLNERQKLLINKLLDNFEGKLTSSKWAKIAKCSSDTALRDIQDLILKNILYKEVGNGKNTHYLMVNL